MSFDVHCKSNVVLMFLMFFDVGMNPEDGVGKKTKNLLHQNSAFSEAGEL